MEFRNIAIIAHVDHGKTTLVDAMLKQSGTFTDRDVIQDLRHGQQRARTRAWYYDLRKEHGNRRRRRKINIVDTPGHADFGSEVERVLRMVDSVLLLVDAYEGPMPQTKFVLRKSLALGLKPIVVINKIDKPTARPDAVHNMIFDLFAELGATDEQLDFKHIYAIGRQGIAKLTLEEEGKDLRPLFDLILSSVPPAPNNTAAPMRMQVANLKYDNYVGRIGVGRVYEGIIKAGMPVTVIKLDGKREKHSITKLYTHKVCSAWRWSKPRRVTLCKLRNPRHLRRRNRRTDCGRRSVADHRYRRTNADDELHGKHLPICGTRGQSFMTSRQIRDRLMLELGNKRGAESGVP